MIRAAEDHLKEIKEQAAHLIEIKYRIGHKRHFGTLLDMKPEQILDEAIAEAVDGLCYLLTLKRGMGK